MPNFVLDYITINFRKLEKMHVQTGTVCTSLLKFAVLCMNSTLKKSHGTTPFRVMWGRDSLYADLVPVLNSVTVSSQDDIDSEEAILNNYDPLLDEFHSDDTFAVPDQPDEDNCYS